MNTMITRRFIEADTEAVVSLWKACGLVVPWNNPYLDIQRKMTERPELFLVGEIDGVVMSSIMGGYEGHRGWINYMAVAPEWQKQHYGQQLVKTIEEKLLALGCPKINLQVRSTNKPVIAFYESAGFAIDQAVSMGKRIIPD